jgi:hypothetical protein
VDQVAPRLSFFFAVGMDFFLEVRTAGTACTAGGAAALAMVTVLSDRAKPGRCSLPSVHQPSALHRRPLCRRRRRQIAKLRAARRLWARLVKEKFKPQDEKSLVLRTHCQVSRAGACVARAAHALPGSACGGLTLPAALRRL